MLYAYSDASIDTSLVVAGARFNLNQRTITYTRYFGFFRRTASVEASIPLANLSGSISGTNVHGSITGSGGLQLCRNCAAEGRSSSQRRPIRRLPADHDDGDEPYHLGADGSIQLQ